MVLVYVDSGVVLSAGLLRIVCHERFLSVDGEAPLRAYRKTGEAAYELRCEVRERACVWVACLLRLTCRAEP
jgi:hypothetical protein